MLIFGTFWLLSVPPTSAHKHGTQEVCEFLGPVSRDPERPGVRVQELDLTSCFEEVRKPKKHESRLGIGSLGGGNSILVVATQFCFSFTPKIGEDEPNLTHIFQMGLKPPTRYRRFERENIDGKRAGPFDLIRVFSTGFFSNIVSQIFDVLIPIPSMYGIYLHLP